MPSRIRLMLRSAAPSRRRLAAAPQGEEQRVSKHARQSCSRNLRYRVFSMSKVKTPEDSPEVRRRLPVVLQKASKSLTAPGSVAITQKAQA